MKRKLSKKSLQLCQSLIIAICLNFATVLPSLAQEMILRTLSVTGQGEYSIPTTITQVQLGVEVQGETAQKVQEEVARYSTQVVNLLQSQDVDELQTTGISLQPQYSYENDETRLIGYVGINTVSFEMETSQVGTLLDEAIDAGATRIDNISFTASDEIIAEAQKESLRQASLDAQNQAQAVLSALNLTQQEIIGIQVNHAAPPIMPIAFDTIDRRVSSAPSTQVIGGNQTIQSSVTLQIRY